MPTRRTLAFTHTTRGMDFSKCSLNYLTRRYAPKDRLKGLPPLISLKDEQSANIYTGSFTLWDWEQVHEIPKLTHFVSKPYKVQDVCWLEKHLLVCGTTFFEIYPINGPYDQPQKVISHPWFSGGHTIETNSHGQIIVSCSGPDAILIFDFDGKLIDFLRIPESLYGANYKFTLNDDLRQHYIVNDCQIGHMNSATPINDGILCSLLIPGAVGHFDKFGRYREIIRGFVGCHGSRLALEGLVYFSDSCNGLLVEMGFDGIVERRFQLQTNWLHDSLQILKDLYLFSLSDENTIELWNVAKEDQIWKIPCKDFGQTTQFLSVNHFLY